MMLWDRKELVVITQPMYVFQPKKGGGKKKENIPLGTAHLS